MSAIIFEKLFFYLILNKIIISCMASGTEQPEIIRFENLIKSADLSIMEDPSNKRLTESKFPPVKSHEDLHFKFPLCSIARNSLLHSMFIMIPLFEIKKSLTEKIGLCFFEHQPSLYRINRRRLNNTYDFEHSYEFPTSADLNLVNYLTFNNLGIGIEKILQINPGFFFFENSYTYLPTLYLGVFIRQNDTGIFPHGKSYKNIYYSYVNNGLITEFAKNSFFELSLNLNHLEKTLDLPQTHELYSPYVLKYRLTPAIEIGDINTLLKSSLTIRLQAAVESNHLVFELHKTFEKIELKDMYIKIEGMDIYSKMHLEKYIHQ
ncbi:hypothetical protein CDIK_2894 [Cucumispora dikerogammari]|nr:hypothetical protein CDIK_2894 [Cucumispora dikerogammari]